MPNHTIYWNVGMQRSNDMRTEREATYEVRRSQGIATIFDNAGSIEERSSRAIPILPGAALNWIDGEWVSAKKTTDSFDPATGERIGTYADASREDAAAAIAAAVRTFRDSDWKENRQLRARVLNQIADRFETRRDDLIRILMFENGKVRTEAALEVDMIPTRLRYWASAVLTNYGRALEVEPGRLSFFTQDSDRCCRHHRPLQLSPCARGTIFGSCPRCRSYDCHQVAWKHGSDQLHVQPGVG
jgi:hypothetical protein